MSAEPLLRDRLDIEALEVGRLHRLLVALVENGAGRTLRIPVLVARGEEDGPTVGLTAAGHGNEDLLQSYEAPEDGVVVGKSTNPVAYSGTRILHLGVAKG